MNNLIAISAVVGAVAAFLLLFGRKSGLFGYLQAVTPGWMPWDCDFCACFWLSVLITILAITTTAIIPRTWLMLLVPVLATVIGKALAR